MDQSEDNMSSQDVKKRGSSSAVQKQRKRSLVERELETNMTAHMTSPASVAEGFSTSRYGRVRSFKTELLELLSSIKHPANENIPVQVQSPVYRMDASNSLHNAHVDNSSFVDTFGFDNKNKTQKDKKTKGLVAKNELLEIEASCPFQVGDMAWARVGTYPFWPCIVTRDPNTELFVKRKLFGSVNHDIIHVTFFGDNGRWSWIIDIWMKKYLGQLEFDSIKEKFTPEDKKKYPKLYAAYSVPEKKQAKWIMSVKEADTLFREPKHLRINLFNEMLWKSRAAKKQPKRAKISSINSVVSLSENLCDSLFSDKQSKVDDTEVENSRKKSLNVSEVVIACLDNMAAKTGVTKIEIQPHIDSWLQKAKSNTPAELTDSMLEKPENTLTKSSISTQTDENMRNEAKCTTVENSSTCRNNTITKSSISTQTDENMRNETKCTTVENSSTCRNNTITKSSISTQTDENISNETKCMTVENSCTCRNNTITKSSISTQTDENIRNETKFTTVENLSTCRNVESPTFSQLLETLQALCQEEEQESYSENCTNENSQHIDPQEITIKVIKKSEIDKIIEELLEDYNESEDAPSPEY